MERFTLVLTLGIISSLAIGAHAQDAVTVTAGKDTVVKATPPNASPDQYINATIECVGSTADLFYYINNRINVDFVSSNGMVYPIAESFHEATLLPNSYYVRWAIESGHYKLYWGSLEDSRGYTFQINIHGVTHRDDGVYNCTLSTLKGQVISSDSTRLTVLNPVTKVKLEIHDMDHNVVATSTMPISADIPAVRLTQGQYMVKCVSSGSNPEPQMSFYYNQEEPYKVIKSNKDISGDRVKWTSQFTVDTMTLKASALQQNLICSSNIQEGNYPTKEAGIPLMIEIDIPNVVCANVTAQAGNRYMKMECNISTEHGSEGLMCDKVAFVVAETREIINIGEEMNTQNHDIMEASCMDVSGEKLKATLTFYQVTLNHFDTVFYLQYGSGENAHRHPFSLNYRPTSDATIFTPLPLCATIIIAMLSFLL